MILFFQVFFWLKNVYYKIILFTSVAQNTIRYVQFSVKFTHSTSPVVALKFFNVKIVVIVANTSSVYSRFRGVILAQKKAAWSNAR